MTVTQAIEALRAAGLADAHFMQGSIYFTCGGKLCGMSIDYRAQVKPVDVAFWVAKAESLADIDDWEAAVRPPFFVARK